MAGTSFWVMVLRPFDGGGVHFQQGDIVDAATWRTRESLIRQRMIRPATAQEVAETEEVEVSVPAAAPRPAPPRAKIRPRSKSRS